MFEVNLDGEGSGTNVISRAVAKDNSRQEFFSKIHGNNKCNGHTECDAIIMDNAKISAIPELLQVILKLALFMRLRLVRLQVNR